MNTDTLAILLVLISGFVFLGALILVLLRRSGTRKDQTLIEWLKAMQSTIEHTNKTLNESMRGSTNDMTKQLQENTKQLNTRLDTAARVIGELQKELGTMSELGRGIKSLQDLLQSPKLRGNLGEEVLSEMIGQSFPKHAFHLQYSFSGGTKVDAVLKTSAGLLPIDAKFPMEQFSAMYTSETEKERLASRKAFVRDVKKHIADISKKYILPDEGTMDFALMYIPSESVFYEISTMSEVLSFARKHRVYPVSPNTLYAHLQVIMTSYAGKQLEQKSKDVLRLISAIQKDYEKNEEDMRILGRHLTHAYNSMNTMTQSFATLGQKIHRATSLPEKIDR